MDTGSFGEAQIGAQAARGTGPYLATGRAPQRQSRQAGFAAAPAPPPADARLKERLADTLHTAAGKALYRRRPCTVEPVVGSGQEGGGCRQFSLRGLAAAAGAWGPVCRARHLQRLPRLTLGYGRPPAGDGPTNGANKRPSVPLLAAWLGQPAGLSTVVPVSRTGC